MNVTNFIKEVECHEVDISTCTLFMNFDIKDYNKNFDNTINHIKHITCFHEACKYFNIPSEETLVIKIFNSRIEKGENYIYFNPLYLLSLLEAPDENFENINLKIESHGKKPNNDLITYINTKKNVFNHYLNGKMQKLTTKKKKNHSTKDFFFELNESDNKYTMTLFVEEDRVYTGGRLSLPNSISFKLVDSTIIYHSKIVFSKEGMSSKDIFKKYCDYHSKIFHTNPNLLIKTPLPSITFNFSSTIFLRDYVSFHSKKMFHIKKCPREEKLKCHDNYRVLFKNISSFEEYKLRKSILQEEEEHYQQWKLMVKKMDVMRASPKEIIKICDLFM